MKFLFAVIDTEVHTGTTDEMLAIDVFNEMLEANGHWIMGAGLEKAKIIVAAEGSKACNRKVELRPFLGN